jgi:hypothetical protein
MRLCACGCKASLDGKRSNARYASNACRTKAYKARHGIVGYRRIKASLNGQRKRLGWGVVTGPLALCADCDWFQSGESGGRALILAARRHVSDTGHEVQLERGQVAVIARDQLDQRKRAA